MPAKPDPMPDSQILLDTHVWLWLMQGNETLKHAEFLSRAASKGGLYVSAMSCWEVAMLAVRGRIQLGLPPLDWVDKALKAPGIQLLDLTPKVAVESCLLPGDIHGDPVDRMLIAAGRCHQLTLATRDEKIIAYGRNGHIQLLEC